MDNKPDTRSVYVAQPSRETMNLYPRKRLEHRNEYSLHDDIQCKVYDDDLRVIEFSCNL